MQVDDEKNDSAEFQRQLPELSMRPGKPEQGVGLLICPECCLTGYWFIRNLTPAHLEALQYVERPTLTARAAHVVVVGGEQLGARLLSRWRRELLPHSTFVNEYGPTEAVVGCTVWTLSDEDGLAELEGKAAAPGPSGAASSE